jgi:NADPH-dependent 2,4-dienoyl-CoA reductase/sulfur reductase-like enzyme
MPYFVKGEVPGLSELLSLSPEAIDDRGIDLRREHRVTAVDPDAQTVTVDGPRDTFEQSYGELLIATGAEPVTEPIEGHELNAVDPLHGLNSAARVRATLIDGGETTAADLGGEPYADTAAIERCLAMEPPETVAIVGGGYVGVEMAEAFAAHDVAVHLFQRGDQLLPPFGSAVGEEVASALDANGVEVHLGEEVARLAGDERVARLECASGEEIAVQQAVVGIGVRPSVELAEGTAIACGAGGAIAVDDDGRTGVADIYAAGDCATMRHAVTDEPAWVPLGLTANRAGRAIGMTVAGEPEPVGTIAGTAVVKAFDQECGRTGIIDHEEAEAAGYDPVTETITTRSRSGYYPGAAETTVSLTADRDSGRVLGGAIVGPDRAAIRIDTLAVAVEQGVTVAELERMDLAYAPPFSPVWDPILVAAKVLRGAVRS